MLLIDARSQASNGLLELAVLGGVDERVHAAVGERQNDGEVIEHGREVDRVADVSEKEHELDGRPAHDIAAADQQRRDKRAAPGCVDHRTIDGTHLKEMNCTSW